MSFHLCQKDAYLRRGYVRVIECDTYDWGITALVENSLHYPEGGGQPADRGTLDGIEVLDVQKTIIPNQAFVTLAETITPGEHEAIVDWEYRYDLMQQHSAQHLITAIAADQFGANTVSFHLGEEYSAIELDVPQLDKKTEAALLQKVNEAIRANVAIRWKSVTVEEYEQSNVRSRGLPKDHEGEVRLVEIEGFDLNTCGGTHVATTGELQSIVFLGLEKLRGQVRLSYLAGNRVLKRFQEQYQRERELSSLLSCPAEEVAAGIQRLQNEAKQLRRVQRGLLQELAAGLGESLAKREDLVVYEHRDAGDLGFLNSVVKNCLESNPDKRLFLTQSDNEKGEGLFLLAGDADWVRKAGDIAASVMEGRGGGKPGRYQGKVQAIQHRQKALQQILETL